MRKKGKTFLVQFPGLTGTILNLVELLVELFRSLQVYRKKNRQKVMTKVNSFLEKMSTL